MKSFTEVLREALSNKQARIYFIIDIACVVIAFVLAKFMKNDSFLLTGTLMALAFVVTYTSERFGAVIRAIKERDITENKKAKKAAKGKKR